MTARNIRTRADRFSTSVASEYQDKYFVDPEIRRNSDDFDPLFGHFTRVFIGVSHRTEYSRLIIYPKISVGITTFDIHEGTATLKQRNANNVYELYYAPEKRTNNHFTGAAATAIGYKLSQWVFVNIDLMASYYKTDISVLKKFTDLNTNQSKTETIGYKKDIATFSVGGGLIFVLR